jgi:hypothetical protein
MDFDIEYLVMQLHDIARAVEKRIGEGKLSQDIRECGDRLTNFSEVEE